MAASSNITVSHATTGLVTAVVLSAAQISPNFTRVTLGGDQFQSWRNLGFDQWFRIAIPTSDDTRFDNLSDRFGIGGYVKYLTLPKATRPEIRSYTVRSFRPDSLELDIDFLTHGDNGVAGPWAASGPVGQTVGLIDQGCGFRPERGAGEVLLVGDDTALPAVLGILRDLPRDAGGRAIIEVGDANDQQPVSAPAGITVEWVIREPSTVPGQAALAALKSLPAGSEKVNAFLAGESKLATGGRRHLVSEWGVPKDRITFCGYWRA